MVFAGLVLSLAPLCTVVLGAQAPQLTGVVRAPGGAAAQGAEVVLSFQAEIPWEAARIADQTIADAEGRFALTISDEWMNRRGWKSLDLWAWSAQSGLAALRFEVAEVPLGQALALELPAATRRKLTLLDPAGQGLAGARVRPLHIERRAPPDVVCDAFETTTDAQGVASVRFDPAHVGSLRVDAQGFGSQRLISAFPHEGWTTDEPLRLFPVGEVQIEVEGTLPPGAETGQLRISTYNRVDPKDDRSPQVGGEWALSLAEASRASHALVTGFTNFDLRFAEPPPALPRVFPVAVKPGETAKVRLVWAESVPVRGSVQDEDGRPVAGAAIQVFAYPARFTVTSDAEGRLAFHANPGALAIEGAQAPGWLAGIDRFRPPSYQIAEGVTQFELPPLKLVHSRASGQVVDAQGRPLPGAWVFGTQMTQTEGRIFTTPCCALADADGRFELAGLDPAAALELGARLGSASAEPVTAAVGGAPVVIALAATGLLPISATLRDPAGRPVPNATVVFWKESPPNHIGGEREQRLAGGATEARSDAQGQLSCGASLDPGVRYSAYARAEGFAPFQSAWFTAEDAAEGLAFELEPLATVAGRLLDREGKPIAGARVFVRGDAPRALETKTDAEGRFELAGLFERGFLLAEHEAHGFLGRRYDGAGELEWRLGASEPAAATSAAAVTPPAKEIELARALLTSDVRAAREAQDEDALLRALQRQAWVDPAEVLAELERQPFETTWMADSVRGEVVTVLKGASPDEAVAVADSLEDPWDQALSKLGVVDALGAEKNARKLELLGSIRASARLVEHPPYRLVVLAKVAERLLDLGERDTARVILDEGLELARTLPLEDWSGYARASFAEELAQVALEPALELVNAMDDADRGRHLGNIAHELAGLDPAAAERLLAQFPPRGDWQASRWAPRVCYRMARADLERARKIAGLHETRGQCLGAMALALADAEPETARTLLREAFDALSESSPRAYPRVAFVGASLLPLAQRLAPAEYDGFVARALALREPRADLERPGGLLRYLWDDGALAFAIGLADPELARLLLEPAVEHLLANGAEGRGSDWRPVYAALAQVDPERAAALCEQGLPADARATIGAVLARTGAERLRFVQDECWNVWTADQEDL